MTKSNKKRAKIINTNGNELQKTQAYSVNFSDFHKLLKPTIDSSIAAKVFFLCLIYA